MTVAYDATGAGASGSGNTGTPGAIPKNVTWTHTCTGSGRYVIVDMFVVVDGTIDVASCGVTYDGVAMTRLANAKTNNAGTDYQAIRFGLANPATGAKTVSATAVGGSSVTIIAANSVSFNGVVSTATATATGTGTSPAQSVTAPADAFIAQSFYTKSTSLSSYTQTTRYTGTVPLVGNIGILGTAAGTGSAVSFGATSGSADWAAISTQLLAVATANAGAMFLI